MDEKKLQTLLDRVEIIEVVNQVAIRADARDWTGLRACFADEVDVDYTSLAGGEPAKLRADALIDVWKATLSGFTATQHLVGSHVVTVNGDAATCVAHFQAVHRLANVTGGDLWVLGGRYDYRLARGTAGGGWKATALRMTALWGEGNQHLLTLAGKS